MSYEPSGGPLQCSFPVISLRRSAAQVVSTCHSVLLAIARCRSVPIARLDCALSFLLDWTRGAFRARWVDTIWYRLRLVQFRTFDQSCNLNDPERSTLQLLYQALDDRDARIKTSSLDVVWVEGKRSIGGVGSAQRRLSFIDGMLHAIQRHVPIHTGFGLLSNLVRNT
jgi:hypothetical protein